MRGAGASEAGDHEAGRKEGERERARSQRIVERGRQSRCVELDGRAVGQKLLTTD